MTNRLRKTLRTYSCCVGILISLTCCSRLHAQAGFFNFNYNGPDSLAVGINCTQTLQGNIPNPIVTSTIGATIITSVFDAATSGFPFSQSWIDDEIAHVFWFVEDNMGHSHTFDFFVKFVDNSPPMFDLTGINDTLFYNSIVQVPITPPVIPIMDNCSGFTQSFVETPRPDTCLAGQFTRTWTATDGSGNVATFTQTVIIAADVTPPTIIFPPQNGSSPCELLATAYPAWLSAQTLAFSAQDPSGIKSLTNNAPASFPPGCKVPLTVTFKATDNCNLMIPTTAVFSTSDVLGPVVTQAPRDTVAYCSPGGNHLNKLNEWISTRAYVQVTDACSLPLTYIMKINNVVVDSATVVAQFWASFDNACGVQFVGNQLVDQVSALVDVDFFVRDACGNETFAGDAVFAAVDTLAPVITGVNTTEQCGGGNDQAALEAWINARGNATAMDDCSASFWTNYSFTTSNGQTGSGTFNAGPYPTVVANNCTWFVDVTFRASDECGNSSARTLRFDIIDTQPPVFSGLSPNITVYCPNPLPTVPAATITDNCDLATAITFTRVYQDSLCDGSYTVFTTWQATDDCGNSSTITQQIFVRDTTSPVFTLVPVGLLMRCDTFQLPPVPVQGVNINATDLCSPVVSITTSTVSNQNPNPALCSHYVYSIVRTFTATDECGNTRTATQLISVLDNLPPVPGGVLDTTALCSALTPLPAPPPTATDACSGPTAAPFFVDMETLPGSCAGEYTLQLNWIANDVCGNQVAFPQFIHVVDTVAPTLSNIPANITVECDAIPAAPNTNGFNGVDNCAPGIMVVLVESEIRNPDLTSCDHWTNYTLRREWTATDDCGNTRVYTQNIQIEDSTPPTIVPQSAIVLPNDLGDCGASLFIPAPLSVSDICTATTASVTLKDTMAITPLPNGGNTTLPVDTMVFHFLVPNTPPAQPATGNVVLDIFIDRADADLASEFFRVFGENNQLLGITTPAPPPQCGPNPSVTSITISANQFNDWVSDGDLVITLAPNGFGGAAINPTCPNSQVRMHLDYNYALPQVPVQITYSVDGGPSVAFPPAAATFLETGVHTVVYTATDCVGNSSTASVQLTVNDVQPPAIASPAPITLYAAANCTSKVTLPFPVITENCDMSGYINKSSVMQSLSFINDPDAGIIPADVVMGISGLIPNAITNGTLTIKFKGDNANSREFFNIFHNATQVTATNLGAVLGSCIDTVVTTVAVSAADINTWAASGTAILRAEANTNPGPAFDFDFINPCMQLMPDQTDGVSRIQAMLEYSYAVINFTITRNSNNMIVAAGALQGTQTMVDLTPGIYTVKYTTTDNAGLMGMTTFPLVVRDTVKPEAKCKPSLIINVNPSGVSNYTLLPSEINNGSTDNCSGTNLTYSLSQSTFTCNQAGSNFIVTMTVTDTSGNSSTCATVVSLQTAAPMPTFNPVCEGDTLQLFANPPTPGVFAYMWTGPTLSTPDQNPVRLNAIPAFQGLYTVQITGATGCTATGSVTVNFANLNVPPISVSGGSGTNFCQGQNVTLNTTTQTGQNVSYQWYLDAPVPVLLATTPLNVYTIPSPPPGTYRYFVKVKIGECLTPNSFVITVNVFARPQAIVEDDKIIICAGEPLAFGTAISGPGLTYQWSGPGWAGSTAQFPLVSSSAAAAQAGIHTLKTFQNGCESIPPDTVEVIVKYTPPKPQINAQSAVCVGDTVVLKATVGGAPPPDRFEWQDSLLNIIVTGSVDSLVLPNVNTTNCGNWRVRAGYQNCFSEWSDPFYFCPQQYPVVTASANNPICQDSTLRLQASGSLGNLNWCWTLPNTNQIFLQNPVLTPGQPGIYQVVGKTTAGCADTAFVTVVGGLAPLIDTIIVNAPVCADGSIASLIPTISSVNAPFTYTWRNGQGVAISTDLTLSFPAVPANNGPYTFVVKDTFGCPSAPETVTVSVQAQVTTPVLQVTPNPICAGGTVQVQLTNSGSYTALSTFHWISPAGDTIDTSTPFLTLNNVQVTQSGAYRVFVSEGVCASPNSNVVNLVVNAIPEAPAPVSNQPVCVGEQLVFDANDIPGATYFWTGPNGFFDSIQNPVRNNAIPGFEGIYTLRVRVNGCFSALATHVVDIMSVPKTPIIVPSSPSPVCLEQLPIPGFLHVSEASQTFGAIYTWIDPATGDTIPNPSPLTQDLYYATLPPALLTPGWHTFQVIAWDEDNPNGQGCSSALSNIVSVRFDTIPDNQAQAAADHPACSSQPVVLQAVKPSGNVTGEWSWISGGPMEVPITNRDSATALFAGVPNTTYTFVWSISSGACKNFSVDTLVIDVVAPEKAEGSLGLDTTFLCPGTDFALNAQQGQYTTGIWSQLNQFGITIADPLEPASPVSGFIPGNAYYFVWTLADIGCGASADTIAVFCYSVKPNILAAPFACTGENCVHAEAQPLAFFETGVWTANPSSVVFTPPNSVSTEACGLIPGLNTLYLTLNNGVCGQNSRDTTTVVYEIFPQANADVVATEFGSPVTFQVLTNDILPMEPPSCTIIIPPTNGTIIGNPSNGSFIYRPNSGFSGADVLTYKICNIRCGENACSSATVTINVGAAGECAVPTVITPNGDTRNETFRLPPECYRSGEGQDAIIEVTIFNQWGDYVYHKKPFLQDVDYWDGRVNNTGPVLPSGTYYFVVKIEGEAKARTGFIQLQTVRD